MYFLVNNIWVLILVELGALDVLYLKLAFCWNVNNKLAHSCYYMKSVDFENINWWGTYGASLTQVQSRLHSYCVMSLWTPASVRSNPYGTSFLCILTSEEQSFWKQLPVSSDKWGAMLLQNSFPCILTSEEQSFCTSASRVFWQLRSLYHHMAAVFVTVLIMYFKRCSMVGPMNL